MVDKDSKLMVKALSTQKNLQLQHLFEKSVDDFPDHIALICGDVSLTYQELEYQTNQLANYLIIQGINQQHVVAIFLDRSLDSYISILAVLKTGAAYVPIEVEYPDERINYILADLPFHSVITSFAQFSRQASIQFPNAIVLDGVKADIAAQLGTRPVCAPAAPDQLCYVIYTSGSTGKPKGVEITHQNICHYVSVASEIYQMKSSDRVYQGFSLAFDASLEELWMAFANGGTLVTCTLKDIRSGVGLIEFLNKHCVTVFSTVPTLLSTLEGTLSELRLLILGGEACPASLIKRWTRDGLTIMNTYGPTEATVIATYSVCQIEKPITIGHPLPGYGVLILDEHLQPCSLGDAGELCISGLGLARGYVNSPAMNVAKFIQNPQDTTQRLYRTGDLARIDASGEIQFLGRIDDQVKLRGFRIELNEIETVMMTYPGINQAVVSLQELDNPTLVAYLLLDKKNEFDLQAFKTFLQQRLPHYMIPMLFELVDFFPLLSSGKVNRKALPKPTKAIQQTHYVPPETDLERQIGSIWEADLQQHPISMDADFFYDLGGHSLTAAKIVSNLRQFPGMSAISILDLYQNPTVRQLAKKFNSQPFQQKNESKPAEKNKPSTLTYYLCGLGQFLGCLLQYAIGAWQLLAVILCYHWVAINRPIFSKDSFLIFLTLFLGMPIASLMLTIVAKWLLLGRVKPGVYKLWGWFYLRWWLVERLQKNIFSAHHLIGSPLINVYYRLLGAKIGKNCYIGSASITAHDLLTIGDHSSIGYDARLLGYVIEDGWLKIGKITVGEHCFVGARSVVSMDTTMLDCSKLDDMSMLPAGQTIPSGQFFSGSPARATKVPLGHIINEQPAREQVSFFKNMMYGLLHYAALVFVMMVYYVCYFPALLLITHFHEQTHYLFTVFFAAPVGALIFLGLHYLGIGACKRLLMNKIKPGIYSVKSLYYLRQWTIVKMLDIDEVSVMADTLYFPLFMRFLGAKLGKHVEMGETPHIIPDLVTIGDEGFTASSVALAWPSVYQGAIKFAPVQVGKRGFIGNDSLLSLGSNLGDEGLIGCMTINPPDNRAADHHTAWFGSPAVFLPKRELVSGYSDQEKFTPSKRLYYLRLAIEFARIILPSTFTLIGLFNMLYLLNIFLDHYSPSATFMLFPLAEVFITSGLVAVIVLLKWLVLGRLKPDTKPIWNLFIWKHDVITYLYIYFVCPFFASVVLGTPFIGVLFRCFGAKIGKKTCINTDDVTEFDLISIGDDVCINAEAVIQTHLYEDRIFKMSSIQISQGCNIGVASVVLYNTVMENNASLGNFSLLMKGERLPNNTSWQGIPAQPISVRHSFTQPVGAETTHDVLELETV